mmetsp:Transcript_18915/g.49627  ORF Transcript_18915/g.49627 Transcript_18915/m.49627 type:complete len:475 (-) Transcript_18915:524-1948(-)
MAAETTEMDVEATSAPASSSSSGPLPIPPDRVVEAPGFDLEGYIIRYSGHTKIARLQLIAQTCPALQVEAYQLLMRELRTGLNVELYSKLAGELGPQFDTSPGWAEETDRKARQTQERLEGELNQNKSNLVKESIRQGYNELGQYHYSRGDLNQAMKFYVRTRDYCTSNRHMAEMCVRVIQVSVDLNNYVQVSNHVSKAEHLSDMLEPETVAKLAAASALGLLKSQQYKQAARKFLVVGTAISDTFSGVIAAEDVALYGGLCAVAAFDRDELKSAVLESSIFRNFLDLKPKIRDAIQDLFSSKYGAGLNALEAMKGELKLDIHLKDHVNNLFSMIKDRCLVQYFSPYLSVSLASMATAFSSPVEEIEASVAKLIMSGQISARIDSQSKTLHVKQTEKRAATYRKVLGMGEVYLSEMQAMLIRMSCLEQDFVVRGRPSMVGAMGGGAGGSQDGDSMYIANQQDSGDMPGKQLSEL